jgi:transcriptional regulator with XRE-family HTH domain
MNDFSFVKRLEKILQNKAITISEFASFIGEDPETVYKEWIGNGALPSNEMINKICRVFDINVEQFLEPDILGSLEDTLFGELEYNSGERK